MRYILTDKSTKNAEIKSRQEYLYDIFKVYMIPFYRANFIELISLPVDKYDLVMIHGHNDRVYAYLKGNIPKEKNIVLITCYCGNVTKIKFPNKNIYFSSELTNKFNGMQYGFHFDITEAELDLYNSKEQSVYKKIDYSFRKAQ